MHRARNAASGAVFVERLRAAHTHWTRLKGLLGTKELPPGDGLWIRPCRQVHMFGMRYVIDLAFLDPDGRVVRTVSGLAPWRVSPRVPRAASVLELPAGTVARAGLTEGTVVEIEGASDGAGRETGVWTALCNLALALLYLLFAHAHVSFARASGQWVTTMPIVVQEAVLVVLFLTRRRSLATSGRLFDWAVGITGSFLPLLMRATEPLGPLSPLGKPLQVLGLGTSVIAIGFLGRSFGLIAANRGIKTGGLYRVVRHPIYAGYVVGYVGYVLSYPTTWNCLLTAITLAAFNARALVEERFLERDARYRAYLRHTRWRFVPYLY